MQNDDARLLAQSQNSLAVAPAGCGKTHLIADAVAHCDGRQLVLTHTHAGVRAVLDHMKRAGLSSDRYRVATIDGFALRYASAFPSISGWTESHPAGESWEHLRPAAIRPLRKKTIWSVLRASYSAVFVDEYQDCTVGQHDLICALSDILPCRVLGDPLQSIFWKINDSDHIGWDKVRTRFELVCELTTPHRWHTGNPELGEWLLNVRRHLIAGDPIDLSQGPVTLHSAVTQQHQLAACFSLVRNRGHSVLALRKWPNQCQSIVRSLNGTFDTMESVECADLHRWASKIETAGGCERACQVIECAKACFARLPSAVNEWIDAFTKGRIPNPHREDYKRVIAALKRVAESGSLLDVELAMSACEQLQAKLVFVRRELWRELRRTIREWSRVPGRTLVETAWHVRNRVRHLGRRVDRRCVSTTLLVKGLQFDHAIVLDMNDLNDAENFYVGLTRASRSLTIFSTKDVIQLARPAYTQSPSYLP